MANNSDTFGGSTLNDVAGNAQTIDPRHAAQQTLSGAAISGSTLDGATQFLGARMAWGPLSENDIAIAKADAKAREETIEYNREQERAKEASRLAGELLAKKELAAASLRLENLHEEASKQKAAQMLPLLDAQKLAGWRDNRKMETPRSSPDVSHGKSVPSHQTIPRATPMHHP